MSDPAQIGDSSGDRRKLEEIVHERARRAVEAHHLRIRRVDHEVFIGRMRAAAVAEAKVTAGQIQGLAGEDVPGVRAGVAGPEDRVEPRALVHRELGANHGSIGRGAGGVVTAAGVHLDIPETALFEVLEVENKFLHVTCSSLP